MKKTKIVCTLGPSSQTEEIIEKLVLNGMNIARLNFSHGTHESHLDLINKIRNVSKKLNVPIGILQDLCGPKIRLGEIDGGSVTLTEGQTFSLTSSEMKGNKNIAYVSCQGLENDVKESDRILIDDGLIALKVEKVLSDSLQCKVMVGGVVSDHKGVNFPDTVLSLPSMTDKDIDDLQFGIENKVDFVALSFVRKPEDVMKLKDIISKNNANIIVISKIEKGEAIKNIDEIMKVTDGVMVARGDLGVEIPIEDVPIVQKMLIKKCNELFKPVITATQMLDSMIRNPFPTRAEVTDIANAIFDGTDAIMLSGESASGKYPVEAVKMMTKTAEYTEKFLPYDKVTERSSKNNIVEAISLATCELSEILDAKAIYSFTSSGRTAKMLSKYKPRAPVFAAVDNIPSLNKLVLFWGVYPFYHEEFVFTNESLDNVIDKTKNYGLIKDGDLVVLTGGIPPGVSGSTNMIKVHIAGHIFARGYSAGSLETVTGKVCKAKNYDEAKLKIENGDILITEKLDDDYKVLFPKLKGIVTTKSGSGSTDEGMVRQMNMPALLGVHNAFEMFTDERIVTLDCNRGIIYEN